MSAAERSIDACCRLVARLGPTEEEEVHKLILTFHDAWFATPDESAAPPPRAAAAAVAAAAATCSARPSAARGATC